jgi:peptidyl-prolyl isomerase E (cyclophilin E)
MDLKLDKQLQGSCMQLLLLLLLPCSFYVPFADCLTNAAAAGVRVAGTAGFGFLEFEEKDDAVAAIDNMHNSEIYGRVLRVNYAQPMKIKGGDKGWRWVPLT